MEKSEKIYVLTSIILVGFVVAVIYHYVLGFYLGLEHPFNSFLFGPDSAFCDFVNILPFIKDLNPYQETTLWINYFPLAYILLFPLTLIKNSLVAYLIFASGFLSFLWFTNFKNFYCNNLTKIQNFQNIFILSIMSYPVIYLFDRGNFDMFLFIVLALFVYSFKSEKYFLSSIFLAIENAIKPFSILFLILFLFKKKYKEFFLSIILTIILIACGFMVLKGNFFDQIVIFIKDLAAFKIAYVYKVNDDRGMFFCASLFSMLKLFLCKLTYTPIVSQGLLSKLYSYLCLVITAITIFFTWREKIFWKQISLLTCSMLLLPYVVFDYKLIFLFIPIWLFVNEKSKSKFDLIFAICFGLLFIPKNIVITHTTTSYTATKWFSLSVIITPLLLLSIFGLIIFEQFYNKQETN